MGDGILRRKLDRVQPVVDRHELHWPQFVAEAVAKREAVRVAESEYTADMRAVVEARDEVERALLIWRMNGLARFLALLDLLADAEEADHG